MTHLHAAAGRESASRGCSHGSVYVVPTYELVILVIGLNCWGYYTPVEAVTDRQFTSMEACWASAHQIQF